MSTPFPPGRETLVPVLHCVSVDDTVDFFTSLGFETTYLQRKPYVYLAFRWRGIEVHYGAAPASVDITREDTGGCLVLVDDVAPYHEALVAAMRTAWGRVLGKGLPRITRYRPGASRFTLMDPSGNALIFIRRDEPDLEYGGSTSLDGLARAIDNARVLREFKVDDAQAYRALKSAVRRLAAQAPAVDCAIAFAHLIDLAGTLGEPMEPWLDQLRALSLTEEERARVRTELAGVDGAGEWFEPNGGR